MDNDILWIKMFIKTFDKHYYDEDTIEIGEPMNNAHVVVNHFVELTEEEKQQARKDAIQQLQNEEYNKIKQSATKKALKQIIISQPSLFDF